MDKSKMIKELSALVRDLDTYKQLMNDTTQKCIKDIMPIKKVIQPEGIAQGILFLLSDQSEYITGTELIIDGGLTARP